jgi:type IV secretion system protein VirB9
MKIFFYIALALCAASCATTVDVEKSVAPQAGSGDTASGGPPVIAVPVDVPPEIIVVEKPVFVPEGTPVAAPNVPAGRQAVQQSNSEGIIEPKDYSKGAMVYDFDPDWVYEIYTQPLRVSDIYLEPGEQVLAIPFVSDTVRWILGAGVSREAGTEVQHIYVKPAEANLEASLIINTDRRVYHVILKSFRDVHMPVVRWRYRASGLPSAFINAPPGAATASPDVQGAQGSAVFDPRFLSFNYRMTYGFFSRPRWLPSLVYDDGRKTYIVFPENVLQRQLPSVFENRNNVINYRVLGNVIIIDKLIEKITVKIENKVVVIEKKSGG